MKKCHCPIDAVARMLGKKWVIILLRDMFMGQTRFKDFLRANPELSNKVLAQKLKEMEDDGLIKRHVDPESADISYSLTPDGARLKGVMREMVRYGKRYCDSQKNYDMLIERFRQS